MSSIEHPVTAAAMAAAVSVRTPERRSAAEIVR
jgi:hypothetical protein